MFEILMYLFENYMEGSIALAADPMLLVSELEQAGFSRHEIGRALDWLHGLSRMQEEMGAEKHPSASVRHYTAEECEQIGIEARGFLLYLEQLAVLDARTREIVIDRLMALNRNEVTLNRLKWVVLLALFNQPDKKSALSLLQDMILSDAFSVLH